MVIDRFYLCNGDSAGSLEELLGKLSYINDDVFFHHVNDERNDFANWIRDCIKDKVLAKKVGSLKNKEEIIALIGKKVNTRAKIKKKIIAQIKGEILNGKG